MIFDKFPKKAFYKVKTLLGLSRSFPRKVLRRLAFYEEHRSIAHFLPLQKGLSFNMNFPGFESLNSISKACKWNHGDIKHAKENIKNRYTWPTHSSIRYIHRDIRRTCYNKCIINDVSRLFGRPVYRFRRRISGAQEPLFKVFFSYLIKKSWISDQ